MRADAWGHKELWRGGCQGNHIKNWVNGFEEAQVLLCRFLSLIWLEVSQNENTGFIFYLSGDCGSDKNARLGIVENDVQTAGF